MVNGISFNDVFAFFNEVVQFFKDCWNGAVYLFDLLPEDLTNFLGVMIGFLFAGLIAGLLKRAIA